MQRTSWLCASCAASGRVLWQASAVKAQRPAKGQPGGRRRPRRSTVIILVSWVLIATLVATLLIMVLQHEAATAVALAASP